MNRDSQHKYTNFIALQNEYIDIHTHRACDDALCIRSYALGVGVQITDTPPFSAGIHPWDAEVADIGKALEYLKTAPLAAIGEIGLDYSKSVSIIAQTKVLEAQLQIAQERNLPVILHCVRAYNDILHILKRYTLKAVIFHGYIGSLQQTATITKQGYYISAGQPSLNSPKTIEAIKNTHPERIFAETDDSDESITEIYTKLADILDISTDKLKQIITDNYKTVFK